MSDPISILEVIKRGGYEASLITTFNATLPFYEEVLLRKLVGAGCRHNVVLMDRSQCAISWASEATRPRLAGHAYTLLPIGAPGAFHPKLCILVGAKKASILIGSHNLTLSGFGYNREITNWIEVTSAKDAEGAAVLADAWGMASRWIEMERGKTADVLIEAALALANFVLSLIANAKPSASTFALTHMPSGPSLIDQISERVSSGIKRIGVVGAFFDKELALVGELGKRWPAAEVVVGIDPDSVQLFAMPPTGGARYVDARQMWPSSQNYLHAKVIYFDAGDEGSAFVSGSANPSRPAWMGATGSCNVEAVLLRTGADARATAEATGLNGIFDLATLDPGLFEAITVRSTAEVKSTNSTPVPLWTGIASEESGSIRVTRRGSNVAIDCAILFGPDMQALEELRHFQQVDNDVMFSPGDDVARIRSCSFYAQNVLVARAMIHHPAVISASSQSSRQHQIRNALSGLGSSEGDISKVIASVERVIFSDETHKEIDAVLRERREKQSGKISGSGPESLSINVADMPKEKKKLRLLKSGDLAYLLDVLLRRLSEGLDGAALETDSSGRTEEEQVGKEGDEESEPPEPILPPTNLTDLDIAHAVSRRARALTRRMVDQLELAAKDATRRTSAVLQLIAVIALIRELRHLDKTPRWRKTGQLLIEERDRRYLLDESLKHLLGSTSHMLDDIDHTADADTDEGVQLRVLLLWLAWDLGEELTEQIGRIWDASELQAKLCANAMFLKLIPPIAEDKSAREDLEQSISRTLPPAPDAVRLASRWLTRHMDFGDSWAHGFRECDSLHIGGYCCVPGKVDKPQVVLELSDSVVGFCDYDRVWSFSRSRVIGVTPVKNSKALHEQTIAVEANA